MSATPPLVLMPTCNRLAGALGYHVVGRKYVEAVRLAGCLPLAVPPLRGPGELDALLALADGVCLSGSPSNVHPRHFGEAVRDSSLPLDEARDASSLPLIRRALAMGVPLLAICRGFQEVNVALGGSLHQAVQEQPGLADHRDRDDDPLERQYGPAHEVGVQPGGMLEALLGPQPFMVNSLHGQGVKRLAEGLRVEALAPDGLVEAFCVEGALGFALGVQWHPEWRARDNAVSMKLFGAFGDACRARQAYKTQG